MPWAVPVVAVLAMPACERGTTSDADAESGSAATPRIELGEIDDAGGFTRYVDGTEEPIIRGLQGGFHIFVDARLLHAPGADEYTIELALTYDDGGPLSTIDHRRTPELEDDEGNPTFPEMIIFIDDPDAAAQRDVVLRADVIAEGTSIDGDSARLFLLAAAED